MVLRTAIIRADGAHVRSARRPRGRRARRRRGALARARRAGGGGAARDPRGRPALAVTMRTPGRGRGPGGGLPGGGGADRRPRDIESVGPAARTWPPTWSRSARAPGCAATPRGERSFHLTSSCGVCGKAALEFVRLEAPPPPPPAPARPELVRTAPPALRARASDAFDRTGGLHATALFEASGELLAVREDVGRHNAMDKAIGAAAAGRPLPASRRARVRERACLVRARSEGRAGAVSRDRGRRRAVEPRRLARPRARHAAVRVRARRLVQRLLRGDRSLAERVGRAYAGPMSEENLEAGSTSCFGGPRRAACSSSPTWPRPSRAWTLDGDRIEALYREARAPRHRAVRRRRARRERRSRRYTHERGGRGHERLAPDLPARHRAAPAADRLRGGRRWRSGSSAATRPPRTA